MEIHKRVNLQRVLRDSKNYVELTNVSLQGIKFSKPHRNISLSYDPFIETKHCLKMHVVPGNFIVASHESCHRSSSSK